MKNTCFTIDERIDLGRRALAGVSNVEFVPFDGLVVDFARSVGATAILRGVRGVTDFDYELQMVGMNRALNSEIEMVFLMAEPQHQAIASKLVKEISRLGGDVSDFVSAEVDAALLLKFGRK